MKTTVKSNSLIRIINKQENPKNGQHGYIEITIIAIGSNKFRIYYDCTNGSMKTHSMASILSSDGWKFVLGGLDIDWEKESYVASIPELKKNATDFYKKTTDLLIKIYAE
jgi:hypothetical protein